MENQESEVNNNINQKVTPWEVEGETTKEGKKLGIDYNRLIEQFGTQKITTELLDKFETITKTKPHYLLKRSIFFSHREFDKILSLKEQNKEFYLYTGRGPSSMSMHLGHMIPFLLCQWLQKTFKIKIVIQLTDDEKYLFKKDLTIEECQKYSIENAKDIMAVGFDPENTLIFSNIGYIKQPLDLTIRNRVNISDNIGKYHFVAVQAAPSFSSSFPELFGASRNLNCLIPCAIDQDPYFRLTRDVAHKLKLNKPCLLHSKFFPALQGAFGKMSSSIDSSAIFMTDTPNAIKKKINKYAFSGGGATLEEHKLNGGNPDIDVAYQYLTFFMEDDVELESIYKKYKSGEMSSGEIKAICIGVVQKFVSDFQSNRQKITEDVLKKVLKC